MDITSLNQAYAIPEQLSFYAGKGELPFIKVNNAHAEALISVYGGQVLAYRPKSQDRDMLFVSEQAYFAAGEAIKGGIPVCWPWFGVDPEGRGRPAHGFARNHFWAVLETAADTAGTQLVLELRDGPQTRELWPHAFRLVLRIQVGKTLSLALESHNTGSTPFRLTQALHSYFALGDINQASISGLEETDYIDHATGGNRQVKHQTGRVTFAEEVNRVYQGVPAALMLTDAGWGRRVHIRASGSQTAVVWNPWEVVAQAMGDLCDDDYQRFVCVETANAGDEVVEVPAGESYCLRVELSIG